MDLARRAVTIIPTRDSHRKQERQSAPEPAPSWLRWVLQRGSNSDDMPPSAVWATDLPRSLLTLASLLAALAGGASLPPTASRGVSLHCVIVAILRRCQHRCATDTRDEDSNRKPRRDGASKSNPLQVHRRLGGSGRRSLPSRPAPPFARPPPTHRSSEGTNAAISGYHLTKPANGIERTRVTLALCLGSALNILLA